MRFYRLPAALSLRLTPACYIVAALALLGCGSDSPTGPAEPEMAGGWSASLGCVPVNCVERFWAVARTADGDGVGRYTVTDTLWRSDGRVDVVRTGDMSIYRRHLVITYSTVGTAYSQWTLAGDLPSADPVQDFQAIESFRQVSNNQRIEQGPWSFRRIAK